MSLFNKKNLENNKTDNKYGISKDDIRGKIKRFPIGVVIRMLEETELQGNVPRIKVFTSQDIIDLNSGGFDWINTEAGWDFWYDVIRGENFNLFFKRYPEYMKY